MRIDDAELIAYRDGKLPPEKVEAVELLLAKSADARLLLQALREPVMADDVESVVSKVTLPANVVPLRRRWVPAAVAALAAGVLAVVVVGNARQAPLGAYAFELEGGEAATRGATPGARTIVGPASRLVLRLRAEEASDAPRALGVFVEDEHQRLLPVDGADIASSRGSFEVTFSGGAWLGAPGAHVVWLHVAGDEAAVKQWVGKTARGGEGWWRVDVERRE
ncbi:MAG: hypothetical protein DI536_08190 [Archangium gephyra]|uniref:Uncharacterized protein n=1 Tax=Archangium gephyra TaxID=48 RepID=A0A2W5VXL4_9BACT|nr:MAG: hypothetical protein DI536_08190 [Archangium gephyra]